MEQELEEFKVEINEKVEANSTKNYKFIRKDPAHMMMGTVDQINLSHADHSGYPDADFGAVQDQDDEDGNYTSNRAKVLDTSDDIMVDLNSEPQFIGLTGKMDGFLNENIMGGGPAKSGKPLRQDDHNDYDDPISAYVNKSKQQKQQQVQN